MKKNQKFKEKFLKVVAVLGITFVLGGVGAGTTLRVEVNNAEKEQKKIADSLGFEGYVKVNKAIDAINLSQDYLDGRIGDEEYFDGLEGLRFKNIDQKQFVEAKGSDEEIARYDELEEDADRKSIFSNIAFVGAMAGATAAILTTVDPTGDRKRREMQEAVKEEYQDAAKRQELDGKSK